MGETRMNLAIAGACRCSDVDCGSKKAAHREPAAVSRQQRNRHRAPKGGVQPAHHQERQTDFDQVKSINQPASI